MTEQQSMQICFVWRHRNLWNIVKKRLPSLYNIYSFIFLIRHIHNSFTVCSHIQFKMTGKSWEHILYLYLILISRVKSMNYKNAFASISFTHPTHVMLHLKKWQVVCIVCIIIPRKYFHNYENTHFFC